MPEKTQIERHPPLISVLCPVGGSRTTTSAAIASVLQQTETRIEVLVIGYDNVHELALPKDPRLHRLTRQSPGIVAALNTGLAAARGRFIARMDDDDLCHTERFEQQLSLIEQLPEPALVGTRVRMMDSDGGGDSVGGGSLRYADWLNGLTQHRDIVEAAFIENPLPHPTWLAHRSLFQSLGGYRQGPFPEDYDLVLRAARHGAHFGKPEATLLQWRDHEHRLTRTDARYSRLAFIELKADALVHPASGFDLHSTERGVWIAGVGRSARRWCDALVTRGVSVRGFVDLSGPHMKTQKRHRRVIDYDRLLNLRGEDLLLGAITRPEARQLLTAWCQSVGWRAMQDYVLAD